MDTEAELLSAMNASNGALVASIARDDGDTAERLGRGVRGRGASWKGCLIGGEDLEQAVTQGGDEPMYGNFPDYIRLPQT